MDLFFKRLGELSYTDYLDNNGFPSIKILGFRIPNLFIISELFNTSRGIYKAYFLPDIVQDSIFNIFTFMNWTYSVLDHYLRVILGN